MRLFGSSWKLGAGLGGSGVLRATWKDAGDKQAGELSPLRSNSWFRDSPCRSASWESKNCCWLCILRVSSNPCNRFEKFSSSAWNCRCRSDWRFEASSRLSESLLPPAAASQSPSSCAEYLAEDLVARVGTWRVKTPRSRSHYHAALARTCSLYGTHTCFRDL